MAKEKTLKSLVLTDSAGKARTLKKLLSRAYLVMSTDGFLKDLPKSRLGIDAEKNFSPDYITVRGKGSLLKEIGREALNARRVFFATTPDDTGEFLAKQCCELFGVNSKSRCRIFFDELTKDAVKNAIENARAIDENLVKSFQARQVIDKFISQKIGEYLSCKIYRGVKVGRFRALLLKLIEGKQPNGEIVLAKKFSPAVLQELAFQKLNFSATKTRVLAEQLFEGINFDKEGYGGLITYPDGEIKLSAENRAPDAVKSYLNESQFKLYELIHAHNAVEKISAQNELTDLSLMMTLENFGVDWANVYSIGIASLIKRRYITADNSKFKITELGRRVLAALEKFFDDDFSVDSYKKISAQVSEIANGKIEKQSVIENYCAQFNKNFDAAMTELGEDAKPQDEPTIDSGEVCEKCGRPMVVKHGRYGFFIACSGYPDCKNVKPFVNHLENTCPKCGEHLTRRDFGRGRALYQCEHHPHCDFQTWDEPQNTTCKICGATMFIHKFKNRSSMFYCGNENCPSRKDHPINKIIEDARKKSAARKSRVAE